MGRAATGRSAVTLKSGTPLKYASANAGPWLTAAVPEVLTTAAGRLVDKAMPRAMWPAERSSNAVTNRISGWACAAMTKGAFREPGETTTSRRPHATHIFNKTDAPRWSVVNMPQRYGAIQAIARRCPFGWIRSYRGSLSTPSPGRSPQRCRHRQTSESHSQNTACTAG